MEGEVEGEAEGEHVEPPPGALGCEGPIEDADTCPSCHKEVTYECDALQCDRCDRWWHLGACCGRKRFPPGHIDWFCSGCLPKAYEGAFRRRPLEGMNFEFWSSVQYS